jgi:hypothetical protein
MSNDRINELPIVAKLLAPTERTRNSDFGPAFVNPDGLEAAALIKELYEALRLCGRDYAITEMLSEQTIAKAKAALSKARAQ